ncbi:hypothetical protein ESB00_17410 [Oleiharenicola lentus]|uniref:Uncharacterized protein n=1 Tax=Oleiharenicola lentus TaxID=2508720 RepID=A0A4Q1C4Y8_9BACT|nr:hypothetical protein [Oleiharenicola lentus]RXK53470.1 hypothetical protein ESB00_17410 [Oleiharenicola lentus]
MKTQIDQTGGYDARITLEEPSETHCSCVGFAPKAKQTHEGLVGIFVNWAHEYPVIRLQIIASRWQPEWPTYQVVRTAAEELFLPVIKEYNRRNRTRYRVRIETQEETLPKLSPAAQKAFHQFAHGANQRCLHPLDWQRFYRFVRVCYATGNSPHEEDVAFFLRKAGFESKYADTIAQVFMHCRDFYIHSDPRRESGWRRRNRPRNFREEQQ